MKTTRRRRRRTNAGPLKITILAVLSALIIVVGMSVLYAMHYTPDVGEDVSPFETQFYHGDETDDVHADDTVVTEEQLDRPVIESHTRREGMYNFLVVGRDRAAFNTDVIMLVSFDMNENAITIMQIPRDTYIESGGKSYKINALYAAMYNKAKFGGSDDPYYDGMVGFVEALEKNLYTQIDYWALINLQGFVNIVNSIGGVVIDIPFDMDYDDPYQNLSIHLKAGRQTLTGEQAEQFIRFRSNYVQADIGRVNAQKIFLSAFLRQLKNNINLKNVSNFIKQSLDYTLTSITAVDCVYFAKAALELDLANMKMFTLPGSDARADGNAGAWYYVMYREDTLALINRYFNVYEEEITDTVFDSHLAFTNEDKPHLNKIYETDATIADVNAYGSSAYDINQNSIDIPLLN